MDLEIVTGCFKIRTKKMLICDNLKKYLTSNIL